MNMYRRNDTVCGLKDSVCEAVSYLHMTTALSGSAAAPWEI